MPSVPLATAAAAGNEHSTCVHLKYIVSSSASNADAIYSRGQEEYTGEEGGTW